MTCDDIQVAEQLAEINKILQKNVAAGIPGISAALSTSHGQWTFTAGLSSLQTSEPIQATHLFGIGSITKVFVAVVVLQLVEDAKVQLSDSVGKILRPEIWEGIENAEAATLESLLSHRASIDSWGEDPAWIRKGRGSGVDPAHIWAKTEALDYLRRPRRTAPAPRNWYYSNTNYTLLGLVVEQVTGSTLEAEIRRRVLEPLEMENTFEGFEQVKQPRFPSRYHWATNAFRRIAGVCPSFPEIRGGSLVDCTDSNLSTSWQLVARPRAPQISSDSPLHSSKTGSFFGQNLTRHSPTGVQQQMCTWVTWGTAFSECSMDSQKMHGLVILVVCLVSLLPCFGLRRVVAQYACYVT